MGCRQRRVPPPAALAGLAALAVAILAGPVAAVAAAPPSPPADSSCQPDKLTVYKMVMHTFWSRDRFPKHYPDWRPPAQWSKVIGRSHDASHVLFRLGRPASAGLRAMAETGHSEVLEDESQGAASTANAANAANAGVMDEFTAPPVHSGAGWTQAEFFVDGNHSRVSLMSRIVPSPDWFVGIDSFDLCVDGGWIDTITIEVDPLDAGTDNGFTFTAPNWPTEPQGVVYRITSTHPQHPAGSFYYPSLKRLPPIATFQFIKVKEYELSEVFRHSEDSQHFEVLRAEHPNSIPSLDDGPDAVQQEMEEERQEEERRRLEADALAEAAEGTTAGSVSSRAVPKAVPSGDKADVADLFLNTYGPWGAPLSAGGHSSPAPTGIPGSATGNATGNATAAATSARSVRRKHKTVRKIRAPRDCRVGDWGPWSECSKSCGIGEMQRRRTVVKHPRRGGRACPPLLETKWCGSARDCAKSYFKW